MSTIKTHVPVCEGESSLLGFSTSFIEARTFKLELIDMVSVSSQLSLGSPVSFLTGWNCRQANRPFNYVGSGDVNSGLVCGASS